MDLCVPRALWRISKQFLKRQMMRNSIHTASDFTLSTLDGSSWVYPLGAAGQPVLLVFFETDCPTCLLTLPYLNRIHEAVGGDATVLGISQDCAGRTSELIGQLEIEFTVLIDSALTVSRKFDPVTVPTLYLLGSNGTIRGTMSGFSKTELNELASELAEQAGLPPLQIADPYDGAPESKPGCMSRHREPETDLEADAPMNFTATRGTAATRVELDDGADLEAYCREAGFADPLPVIPPTLERVEAFLEASHLPPHEIVGRVPPNYGAATVEKIAANAVMAGCESAMMRVLVPLLRAACDERFNLHGIQATTHFAAPLIIVNGPIRKELEFASASNVFSNVARANSTLGRAFQLILTNLGGARPGEIDMSTLGHPGKFSYCIAENEEASPWEPLHVGLGFQAEQSALTLFAAEPLRGVSEHTTRQGKRILQTISRTLVTIWSYRMCGIFEAIVVLCPEHADTLRRDGFSKSEVRQFLFENTGVPVREFGDDDGEGTQFLGGTGEEVMIDGELCYRKFSRPGAIQILVAGGPAGKFSAVIGSWVTGDLGSQMVTYPID